MYLTISDAARKKLTRETPLLRDPTGLSLDGATLIVTSGGALDFNNPKDSIHVIRGDVPKI